MPYAPWVVVTRIRLSVSLVFIFAMLATSVLADTVTLKNGERLEGKIIKESEKELTMEVRVSAGIIDERVLPRAQIERIGKVTPEGEAYRAIVDLQLGPTSLTTAQYDLPIRTLQAYLTQFPQSAHTAAVKEQLRAFADERRRVGTGEAKIEGAWLSKAETQKEKVQIDGRLVFAHMKGQSATGDCIGALNTFDALEKAYPGASVMPEAIELARQVTPVLKAALVQMIPNQKALKAEREKGFAAAGAADRTEMVAASKKEQENANALVAAAESAGQWAPLIANNEKSLSTLLARVDRETIRIVALPADKMRQSLEVTETGRSSLASGDWEAALNSSKGATALWSANELAIRLNKEAGELKTQAAKPVAPAPATPQPIAPLPKVAQPAATPSATPSAERSQSRP